jgi:2-polyprenyl-3-methyl-5-hydroxy-6-metoxy-1,4-benzoquinol methylase
MTDSFTKDFIKLHNSDKCIACVKGITGNVYFFSQVFTEDCSKKSGVYVCKSCGLAYAYPFLSINEEKRIYEDYISHHFSEYVASNQADNQFKLQDMLNNLLGGIFFKSRNIWLKKILSCFLFQRVLITYPIFSHTSHGPLKILDIGCGDGYFLKKAIRYGCVCYGTEYHDALVRRLNSQGIKASTKIEDFEKEIKNNNDTDKFDIIRINWVLEHVMHPQVILVEARRLLRDNGELIIGVPNFNTPSKVFGEYFQMHIPQHRQVFTKGSIKKMLRACGFKVVFIRTKSIGILGPTLARRYKFKRVNLPLRLIDLFSSLIFDLFNIGDCLEVYAKKDNFCN